MVVLFLPLTGHELHPQGVHRCPNSRRHKKRLALCCSHLKTPHHVTIAQGRNVEVMKSAVMVT